MKKILFILLCFLCACQSIRIPPQYAYDEIQTSTFKIAVWKKIENPSLPYKLYIEGDGSAFTASGRISSNPTPRGTLVRELAFSDPHSNVIYLARACQYVEDSACSPIYWSTARFSDEAVTAEYEAIKKLTKQTPLTIVGFSGGAQIAGLMAVKHPDLNIRKLVTIAGNLNVRAWTDYHKLPPLDLSDDLKNYADQYARFPQVHYVGEKDDNIIPRITENFVSDRKCIIKIKSAAHASGWESAFQQIQAE